MGDLAAFVGRNESGKTTILQALTLLNKDEDLSELDLCDEMTERLKSEIRVVEGDLPKTASGKILKKKLGAMYFPEDWEDIAEVQSWSPRPKIEVLAKL